MDGELRAVFESIATASLVCSSTMLNALPLSGRTRTKFAIGSQWEPTWVINAAINSLGALTQRYYSFVHGSSVPSLRRQ